MTTTDISDAAVERVCHNLLIAHQAGDGDEDLPEAAALLRALRAALTEAERERDAARAALAQRGEATHG